MNFVEQDHKQAVQEYYGQTLQKTDDLLTNACCSVSSYPPKIKAILSEIHPEVVERFFGCGLTIPSLLEGLKVIDLGSGSGRDAYILSRLVGEKGQVTGVDMTPEQLDVARKHMGFHQEKFGYPKSNVQFLEGDIQNISALNLQADHQDLIISNCVINLVDDKLAVFKEAYRLLKPGGELYFSDVYTDKRVPLDLKNDPVLYGECLSGALYWNDFLRDVKAAGFADPRWVDFNRITIENESVQKALEGIQFYSVTCRLIKLAGLEPGCEDYGQAVRYRGGVEEMPQVFWLDQGHAFAKDKIELVCGNSYRMLKETRFAPYFDFFGDFNHHHGVFPGCGGHFPFAQTSSSEGPTSNCGC
ncbi:MAG: methyltransferase domain-containing protein [bacterium]|nr:methyltransferase domain-containing protein [bacterium]